MGKLLLFLAMSSLMALFIVSLIAPDSSIMWIASASLTYQIMRLGLSVILFVQLLTQPPREVWFRAITGLLAVSVAVWAIYSTYIYQMPAADTLAFIGASLAVGVTALEYPYYKTAYSGSKQLKLKASA